MDIKTRNIGNKTIKTFNKSLVVGDKFKDNLVKTKEKVDELSNLDDEEYVTDKVSYSSTKSLDKINNVGRKSFDKTKQRMNYIKNKSNLKKVNKFKQKSKKVKIKTDKVVIKQSEKAVKDTVKVSERMIQASKKTLEVSIKTAKTTIKATIKAIKDIIEGSKALIELLIAGGWISVVIILLICIIGLLCSSIFGIFFSNESGLSSMTSAISEINNDVNNKIENIKRFQQYDELRIDSSYTNLKEIIAVYSVKYNNDTLTMYLSSENISKLKSIFWSSNTINSKILQETSNDNVKQIRVLHISFESKTKDEIMKYYNFNEKQIKEVNELLSNSNDELWNNLLYGSSNLNNVVVSIALKEVGYTHGDKYWSWYGFDSRVEWCAIFVSWVANEAGILDNSIPKFSGVATGINWFKQRGLWKEKGYIPKSGDIIFFDWEPDGKSNHVGIVDHVEGNIIYTIEGNSTDDGVRQRQYNIDSNVIFGYGIPIYN